MDDIYGFQYLSKDKKADRIKELLEDNQFICQADKRDVGFDNVVMFSILTEN